MEPRRIDSMNKLSFQFLTPEHRDSIVALRKECYSEYYGERLNPVGLEWNYTDQHSIHLAIKNNDELISYLRLSFFNNNARLEKTTLFPTPSVVAFPVGLLARAATKKEYSSYKLHSTLRMIAIDICNKLNTPTILGSLEERSIRLSALTSLGYQILDRQPHWPGSYIQSTGPVVLIGLYPQKNIAAALDKMKQAYPTTFQVNSIPEVTYL
jgi:hypothetical protein